MKNIKKYLVDSIHDEIVFEKKIIYDLIFTKEMQRLRYIKQLGGSNYIFPSAEHSRFIHSLGVYELTRRLLLRINSKEITELQEEAVLIAALLHDIGHGPFSHSFEFVCENFKHEEMTIELIKDKTTEINKLLNAYNPKLINEIVLIIKREHKIPWLFQLISSQLDTDRLDYLMRDSISAGPRYGNVEVNRIFNTIMINNNNLVFDIKGVTAIENFLLGRYHMYETLYMNPKSMGFDYLLLFIINRLRALKQEGYKFKTEMHLMNFVLDCKIDIKTFLKLNDNSLIQIFDNLYENEKDEVLKKLLSLLFTSKLLNYVEFDDEESYNHYIMKNLKSEDENKKWKKLEFEYNHVYKFDHDERYIKNEILIMKDKKILKFSKISPIISLLAQKEKDSKRRYIFYYE